MATVLTVDDSSSIRMIVGRTLRELGFAIEQAEDGAAALALLEHTRVDLILLDVTMPVMDGPTMLRALRARGDRTPVIMLTSESKRSIVAGALQLGIEDYMLKPFKPDELRARVHKALRLPLPAPAPSPEPVTSPDAAAPAAAPSAAPTPAVTDVLLVDDLEAVHRKLRQLLPAQLTLATASTPAEAVSRCRTTTFRVVIVDTVMPGVDCVQLAAELRLMQPDAVFLALAVRTSGGPPAELAAAGFADHLWKPFEADGIAALVERVSSARDLLTIEGAVITAAGCEQADDLLERHYARLRAALTRQITAFADESQDEAIVDLRKVPLRPEHAVDMIVVLDRTARGLGLRFSLVGTPDYASLLRRVAATADIPVHDTLDRARGLAA